MTDLREGRIQAFLDGELDEAGRVRLLKEMAADPAFAAAVERQRARIAEVTQALDSAFADGVPENEMDEAWNRISHAASGSPVGARPRLGLSAGAGSSDSAGRNSRSRQIRSSLAKAAALLLFATGVGAATVPGSPFRAWIADWYGPVAEETTDPEALGEGGATMATGPESVGLRLPATGGRFEVSVSGPLSSSLSVALVDGDELEVVAATGTRFATGQGRIEVSRVQGPLAVRVPRGLAELSLSVDGEAYLRVNGGDVEILRAGVDSLPAEFVFTPGADGDEGS